MRQIIILTFIHQMAQRHPHCHRQTHLFGKNSNRLMYETIRLKRKVIIKVHSTHHHIVHFWGKSYMVLMLDTLI